jgi:hypothetical protein
MKHLAVRPLGPGLGLAVLVLFAHPGLARASSQDADSQKKITLPAITYQNVLDAGKLVANPGAAYLRYQQRRRQAEELDRLLRLIEEQERLDRQRDVELLRLWAIAQPRWFRPDPYRSPESLLRELDAVRIREFRSQRWFEPSDPWFRLRQSDQPLPPK